MDTTAPLIRGCPSNQTITYESAATQGLTIIWTEPHATDISGTADLISRSHQPEQLFPDGSTTVSYTFSDASGNKAVCRFVVTVNPGERMVMAKW